MSNMSIYIIGMIILIAGLAIGASQAGLSITWIIVGALVILGIGVMMGVAKTRRPENPG